MDTVRVHCYGCPAVVSVDSGAPEKGLVAAGWALVHGQTYCPSCAGKGGLAQMRPGEPSPAQPVESGAPLSTTFDVTQPSREQTMLDKIEARARLRIKVGAVAFVAGMLLLAGLSSSPVGVSLGAVAVLGGPVVLLWDERAQQLAKQGIGLYLALMAFWVAYPVVHGSGVKGVGVILSWAGLVVGLGLAWRGIRASSLVGVARSSLNGQAFDLRLETRVRRAAYGGQPSTSALLWGDDSETPLAWFDWQMSQPQLVAVDKTPAKVYGAPTRRAVVVVSCPQAIVAGRVKRSHFGESPSPPKPVSPLTAWLWKPRSLRLP
jgi:hypothetical protein